ncbi:MAG: hypothetical protein ACYTHJ_04010 [Planctomycetota bacterium]|jgi:hypothetical protein
MEDVHGSVSVKMACPIGRKERRIAVDLLVTDARVGRAPDAGVVCRSSRAFFYL